MNEFQFNQAVDYCEAHPDEHNQKEWAEITDCGTTRCLAGTVLHLNGYTLVFDCRVSPSNEIRTAGEAILNGELE